MARIGLALGGGLAPGEIVDCVKLAEELGYESAGMSEGHGGDQFSILTACALETRQILLGTRISSVFVRSVPTIAMAAATVDHLSHQRFILGLDSSHKVQVEPEHGIPYGRPLQRVRESVEIIRALLRDGVVSYRGKTVTIERFELDDEYLEDLKAELIDAQRLAVDEDGKVLVWISGTATAAVPVKEPERAPRSYTLMHLAEQDPPHEEHSRRRAQASHGALRRPEGLHGVARRPGSRRSPPSSSTQSSNA